MARVDEVLATVIGGAGQAAVDIVQGKLAAREARNKQDLDIIDKYLTNKQLEYNRLATYARDRISGRTAQTAKDQLDWEKGEADRAQKAIDTRLKSIATRIDGKRKEVDAELGKEQPDMDAVARIRKEIQALEDYEDAIASGDTKASFKDYKPDYDQSSSDTPATIQQAQAARDAILARKTPTMTPEEQAKIDDDAYKAYLEILGVDAEKSLTPDQVDRLMKDINESDEYTPAQKAAIQLELETTGKVSSASLKPWGTSKSPDLGDEIAKFAEASGLKPDEIVKLAEYLKPKLGSFSSRSKFTQVVIKNAIKGVLAMEGEGDDFNRVDAWIDKQIKMGDGRNMEPYRLIYNKVLTAAAKRGKDYQDAVSFMFGALADDVAAAKTPEAKQQAQAQLAEAFLIYGEQEMTSNTGTQRRMGGSRLLLAVGLRLQDALKRLTQLGVDTGAIDAADLGRKDGIYEKIIQNIVGGTSNPNYVEIENLSQLYQAAYTLMVSGTAASDAEVQRIRQNFIDITLDEGLNKARIDSLVKNSYAMLQDAYGGVYGSGLKKVFSGEGGEAAVKSAVQGVSTGMTWESVEQSGRDEESIEDRKRRIGEAGGMTVEAAPDDETPKVDPVIAKWAKQIADGIGSIDRLRAQLEEAGHDKVIIDAWIQQVEAEVARLAE